MVDHSWQVLQIFPSAHTIGLSFTLFYAATKISALSSSSPVIKNSLCNDHNLKGKSTRHLHSTLDNPVMALLHSSVSSTLALANNSYNTLFNLMALASRKHHTLHQHLTNAPLCTNSNMHSSQCIILCTFSFQPYVGDLRNSQIWKGNISSIFKRCLEYSWNIQGILEYYLEYSKRILASFWNILSLLSLNLLGEINFRKYFPLI